MSKATRAVSTEDFGVSDPDYTIGGIDWLGYASSEFPYQRQLAKQIKDQLDTSGTPGDNSLEGWWLSSQSDWSGGAGQKYFDPPEDEVLRMYQSSVDVDPFTVPGEASVLPRNDTRELSDVNYMQRPPTMINTPLNGGTAAVGIGNNIYLQRALAKTLSDTNYFIISGELCGGKTLVSMATGTEAAKTGFLTRVVSYDDSAGQIVEETKITGYDAIPLIRFVKNRVIFGAGQYLYELTDFSSDIVLTTNVDGTDQADPIVDMRDDSWQWTGACSTPTAILVSGYGNAGSTIQSLSVDDTGALPDISAPATVAEFPITENVLDMCSYLGTYIGLATTQGIRVGVAEQQGLTYGPLIGSELPRDQNSAGKARTFSTHDRFLAYVGTDGVMYKVDLSVTHSDGRNAWSSFLRLSPGVDSVGLEVAVMTGDRTGVGVSRTSTQRVQETKWVETNGNASDGELVTSIIRFNTVERKLFESITVTLEEPVVGSVEVYADGNLLGECTSKKTVLSFGDYAPDDEVTITFKFKDTGAKTPVLTRWSIRALPAVENRGENIVIPLLNFDIERNSSGVTEGYEGRAWERWEEAIEIFTSGTTVEVDETRTGGIPYPAIVESLVFTQVTPPTGSSGFGGVVQVSLRTI